MNQERRAFWSDAARLGAGALAGTAFWRTAPNRCALSVPCHDPGSAPVGLMIAGTQHTDRTLRSIGLAVEQVVWRRPG